ncbi:Hypothetical predicted protein [Lynx pardinus]|uniref:Uncharacterized protein n=1 Tax=Lynx pardinus TaxID=191816 RepID=A0A485NBB0_LYNPA|nr:Hypothetical predicted protein [Lynx pardinus]
MPLVYLCQKLFCPFDLWHLSRLQPPSPLCILASHGRCACLRDTEDKKEAHVARRALHAKQGLVFFKVQVPNIRGEKEWKLRRQVLVFTLLLTDKVFGIMEKTYETSEGTEAALGGHFRQGFQLTSLLQHGQWCNHLLALKERGRGRK